jgi:hypothetical protein
MADPTYVDDPTIANDANLWRRVPPAWIVRDENRGGYRPSSQAFHDSQDGSPMSVLISETMAADGRGPQDAIADHPGFFLASFTAGEARSLAQGVSRTPTATEPAHGSVFGEKTRKICRALSRLARWVIAPPK